jgi:hypothetical protein
MPAVGCGLDQAEPETDGSAQNQSQQRPENVNQVSFHGHQVFIGCALVPPGRARRTSPRSPTIG